MTVSLEVLVEIFPQVEVVPMAVVTVGEPSGSGLPAGGTPGQVVTNTAPGVGDWEDLPAGGVSSVNTQTGDVVLDPDDLDDTATTHKFVTAAEKTKLANTSGTNTGDQDLSGLVPTTRTVNGHPLSSNVTVTASDVGADPTGTADAKVSDAVYGAGWDGDTTHAPSKNAVYDKIQTLGAGATNLSYTASPTDGTVVSDTGTDATIPLADGTNAGLLTPAEKTKLANTSGTNTGDQTLSGLGGVPTSRTVAGHALSADVTLVKGDVGLGNVDNTADTAKPVSTAQQTAIDGKVSDTAYNATSWDAVTSIAPSKNAVRDKLEALDAAKANLASPTFTGTVTIPNGAVLGTPASIDLSNGTNIADSSAVKIISRQSFK